MRVIPSIFMLVAISGASANASAGKFDLGSMFESVLTSVLLDTEKVHKYEHGKQQKRTLEEVNEYSRQQELKLIEANRKHEQKMDLSREFSRSTCDSIRRCNEFPHLRRVISGDLENVPYICELDDLEGASRRVDIEYNRIGFENFVYASNEWLAAEKQCHQRLEVQKEENAREIRRKRDLESERQRKNEINGRKKMAEISKLPEPKIGMTKDQVKKGRWGKPVFIELNTNTQGTYEKWSYYFNRTLYFTNGKLTKIEEVKSGL